MTSLTAAASGSRLAGNDGITFSRTHDAPVEALRVRGREWVIRTLQSLAEELGLEISDPHAAEDPDAPRKETMTFRSQVRWRLREGALEDSVTDEKVRTAIESDVRQTLQEYAALSREDGVDY
jgi:hypothetical protein